MLCLGVCRSLNRETTFLIHLDSKKDGQTLTVSDNMSEMVMEGSGRSRIHSHAGHWSYTLHQNLKGKEREEGLVRTPELGSKSSTVITKRGFSISWQAQSQESGLPQTGASLMNVSVPVT